MTKSIIFDSGPIISFSTNNLLWLLEPLQKQFGGDFYITWGVYSELVERPLNTKKYKFEALQILPYINEGILKMINGSVVRPKAEKILDLANSIFKARGNWIQMVHRTEMEVIAAAIQLGSSAIVVDERATRLLIENPRRLIDWFRKRLHTNVSIDQENLSEFRKEVGKIKVIRSVELATIAYELGLFSRYMYKEEEKVVPQLRKTLLEGVLWGIKLNGCSISREEIDDIVKIET